MDIPHGAWVAVADGAKWLIFRNDGDPDYPALTLIDEAAQENLPDREIGTDRPGRAHQYGVPGRSAKEEADFHQQAEDRFAKDLADWLYDKAQNGDYQRLILVAAPKLLGVLRQKLHGDVTQRCIAEVTKDLVKHPVTEIEKIIAAQ